MARLAPCFLLLCLLYLPGPVAGSHFRYGTLSWVPLDNMQMFGSGLKQQVEIYLSAAYRRDYEWGRNFGERWAQTSDTNIQKVFYGNEYAYQEYDATNAGCNFFGSSTEIAACFDCPTSVTGVDASGISSSQEGCLNTAPQLDIQNTDSNDNTIPGEKFYILFPPKRQDDGVTEIVQCVGPYDCDIITPAGVDNSVQQDLCSTYRSNPSRDPLRCAPWYEVYGMFTGDEDGKSIEVELEVTDIDQSTNPVIGNFVVGRSTFRHYYLQNSDKPYIAYFTGGDRVYECAGGNQFSDDSGRCMNELQLQLNNNAEGRFRLELAIWIRGDGNSSPRVTMIPIIPVPRATIPGGRSRFQVAAYDPDIDELRFRFGNDFEMGGLTRSKSSAYPFSANTPPGPLGATFVYGPFPCDAQNKFFRIDGTCPTDRAPQKPNGTDSSFTSAVPGLIEWETFDAPPMLPDAYCPNSGTTCTKLRSGLYNFIVMVEDIPPISSQSSYYQLGVNPTPADAYMTKSPVDFMAYLYDGPMYFCNGNCQKGTPGLATYASRDGLYDTCSVCGLGPNAEVNNTNCVASSSVGPCGELAGDGITIVPPTDACAQNRPPRFISVNGKENDILDTPEVDKWEAANTAIITAGAEDVDINIFKYPTMTQYFGTDVQFWVTAIDYDDCTDLTLLSTGLPFSSTSVATFGDYINPTAPDGQSRMVRRLFRWAAPPGSATDDTLDNRDAFSLVCFMAYDIYHATADPFYCMELNLKQKPSAEEETLLRFECKMSLLWSPVVQRFVFADMDRKYYTICRYEDYMWHHALVTVNETGFGQLYIDGVPAELMEPIDSTDLSRGFDNAPLNTYFETNMFATKCVSRRRGLLSTLEEERLTYQAVAATEETTSSRKLLLNGLNDFSDQPVGDVFATVDEDTNPGQTCCSFKIGLKCDPADVAEYKTFAGLLDEVAVWNRELRPEEVKDTLFKMPQKLTSRDLEGPRGVQIDYTAGRLLYARFNNPCMESPQQAPPPPSPPPPADEGSAGRRLRRLHQISNQEIELFRGQDGTGPPPPPVSDPIGALRREYIADKAGFTAGVKNSVTGQRNITDIFDPRETILNPELKLLDMAVLNTDATYLSDFPWNTQFAYTGVPWEAPFVTDITTVTDSSASLDDPLPIDGSMRMRVSGIGFARSSFAKCVVVQPDPAGLFQGDLRYTNPDEDMPEYNNYYRETPGRTVLPKGPHDYDRSTQVMKSNAYTMFGSGNNVPSLSMYDFHSPQTPTGWDITLDVVREGNINAFQENVYDSHSLDYFYGSWEIVECVLPPAAFPSQDYIFGVSNDAGLTGSPPTQVTFMDYSVWLNGTSQIIIDPVRDQLGSVFTISFWVYPTKRPASTSSGDRQYLLELGSSSGIIFDGTIKAVLDNRLQSPSGNETEINMWHFVVFVADGTTASFYLDGIDEFGFGGGDSTRSFTGYGASGPSLLQLGSDYFGYFDEVKMWTRALSLEEFVTSQIMFARELPSQPTGVMAYYRFNNLTTYIDGDSIIFDELKRYDGTVSGPYEYHPMTVPWEPSTIYSINEIDALTEYDIMTAPQTGLVEEIKIEGFNFARSFSTGCYWGQEVDMKVPAPVVAREMQPFVCTIPSGEELNLNEIDLIDGTETYDYGQGALGRPDNRSAIMMPYRAMYVNQTVAMTRFLDINEEGTTMHCESASVPNPQFAMFSAGNIPTFNSYPYEFTEVALECTGSNHIEADDVSSLVGGRAYTFGAWIMPHKEEDPVQMEMRRTRSLLSTDKNLRRKLMQSNDNNRLPSTKVVSTVLAFESNATSRPEKDIVNSALIMYDGMRFFYYDDCILDVTQTGEEALPGEWHFVMVSVDIDGEGTLNVDGISKETFTTTCKPETTGMFSICQDFAFSNGMQTTSSFFLGQVDEIMVFDRAMSFEMMSTYMIKPYDLVSARPVAYFPFSGKDNMLPYNAVARPDEMWVKATGPWTPATVVAIEPDTSGASGRTLVSVFGTNFAQSQWLRVNFGGELVAIEEFIPSGVTAYTTAVGECNLEYPVLVSNTETTPANNMLDAAISYNATVEDLARDVFARYTYDYVRNSSYVTEDREMVLAFDLSGNGGPRESLKQFFEVNTTAVLDNPSNFMIPLENMVSDKDQFQLSAVYFNKDFQVPIPIPDTPTYTICAWLFMFINEQVAPMAGGWKLVCMVKESSEVTLVYLNTKVQDEVAALWFINSFSDVTLGNNEEGYVDEMWVYSRALLPCEIVARYYTQEYALDFVKGKDYLQERPAIAMLPVSAGTLRFNLEMWIYPYVTDGMQTIASTDGARQVHDTLSRDLGLHFGIFENSLTFSIHKGCTCQPCPALVDMISWKSKVFPNKWQHVSFIYPFAEGLTIEPTTMAIHVDGVLRDMREFPDVIIPEIPEDMEMPLLLGQESTDDLTFRPFAGLMYDLRWTNNTYFNYKIKKSMQCPPKNHEQETYFEMNEGSGGLGSSGAVMGLDNLWTNTSYDDPTSRVSTTFYGDLTEKIAGEVGRFVITSRTACQKKRVVGGDNYQVTMTEEDGNTFDLNLVDTNDGNYHVQYSQLYCGKYDTNVYLDDELLHNFEVTINPGKTDPQKTFVVNQIPTPNCFGVQTEFDIQTIDEFGCLQAGHNDVFIITFDGPHKMNASVTPKGAGGLYRVSFMPMAPGNYHMTMNMLGEDGELLTIMDGTYFCINVCTEGAVALAGAQGIVVEEDMPGISDLDLSFPGMTMELWFKLPAGFDPSSSGPIYLLHKGGTNQQGQFAKTYELVIDGTGEVSASVYVGLGEIRSCVGNIQTQLTNSDKWFHIAASYNGTYFEILLDGQSVASVSFAIPMMVKTNSYNHPLEIGAGLPGGFVDEVKLWKVARSPEDIIDSMYCAPYQRLMDVAAYFSFNEGSGSVASGHGAQCTPEGEFAIVGNCLQGVLLDGATFTTDTPSTSVGEGYNAASGKYSEIFGPGISVYPAGSEDPMYTVIAKDKCNFVYTKNDASAYSIRTQHYGLYYNDERPPTGIEYPTMFAEGMSVPVYALPSASRQCPGDPTPGPFRGDVFTGFFARNGSSPTTESGSYLLEIAVDNVPIRKPFLITVVAHLPHHFYVAPLDAGFSAGVPFAFKVQMKDKNDNIIYVRKLLNAEISLLATVQGTTAVYTEGRQIPPEEMVFNPETGEYTILTTLGYPGSYSLVLVGLEDSSEMNSYFSTFEVKPAAWRKLLTNDLKVPMPTKRFEHTSAVYNGDIYIFGGALYDRTYVNDLYVLKNAVAVDGMPATDEMLAYKKTVTFGYTIFEEKALTLEVRVNTAELLAANRMNPTCLDVVFTMPNNGEGLDFYLDPFPGCNSTETLYIVKLPVGTVSPYKYSQDIEMYYGNPSIGPVVRNDYNDPKAVFFMYEGFETGSLEKSIFRPGVPCTSGDSLKEDMDRSEHRNLRDGAFEVTQQLPFAGKSSLYVGWGEMGVLVARAPMPVKNFKLRAWFYDSDASNSSHYMSPDFMDCDVAEGEKSLLPESMGPLEGTSTAVGTYTLAHTTKYCVASPWESTSGVTPGTEEVFRSAGWHQLEVYATSQTVRGPGRLVISIDRQPVKNVSAIGGETSLDKVLLSAGFGVDGILHPGLNLNHAFWDEVSVALLDALVDHSEVTSMEEDENVAMIEQRFWHKLEVEKPPPPRYAHSSVVYDDKMYIFGGERSAYAFNDIWEYSFEDNTWNFVTPRSRNVPSPRYDHTAAVTDDGLMIIYGGRNGMTLHGDMWSFDLVAKLWAPIAPTVDAGARFGHTAAIPKGSTDMYIFGGYADYGFSGAFFRCEVATGKCFNITLGCENPEVSSIFLPTSLIHRYEHTSFADDRFVYIYGGASVSETYGFGGVYKFSIASCSFEELPTTTAPPIRRFEHVAGLIDGGFFVHGGHAGGDYYDDAYFFPL